MNTVQMRYHISVSAFPEFVRILCSMFPHMSPRKVDVELINENRLGVKFNCPTEQVSSLANSFKDLWSKGKICKTG